jgi:hypothetical protein
LYLTAKLSGLQNGTNCTNCTGLNGDYTCWFNGYITFGPNEGCCEYKYGEDIDPDGNFIEILVFICKTGGPYSIDVRMSFFKVGCDDGNQEVAWHDSQGSTPYECDTMSVNVPFDSDEREAGCNRGTMIIEGPNAP